ncbi:MAG: PQQ-dependent sugar dehydrogenase, partial [Flavobacteriales bacterium]
TWAAAPFLDITDRVNHGGGEQGLLGLAFHPNYAANGFFYVFYTGGTGVGTSRVSRFSVSADPNDANEGSEFTIWTMTQPGPDLNHRGGDIHFGPDGNLLIGLGDTGGTGDPSNRAQNLTLPWGKMLRINVDGGSPYTIPPTNPYATTGGGVLPEIWASGLRNPWRFSIDPLNGDVWIGDVGQSVQEEIDRWPGGNNSGPNFGWRCYEGSATYNTTLGCTASYVPAVATHTHTANWCAIVGGNVYRGAQYSRLTGRYIYVDWCLGQFISLRPNGAAWTMDTLLTGGIQGFAAMGEDMNGELFVCNQGTGNIYKITDPYAVVRVSPKVFLEGPFDGVADQMKDDLRAAGLVPAMEPYSTMAYEQHGSGNETVAPSVLAVTGANAIVDWVRVELRQSGAPANIVASANALVQRDGDVVATDGVSPVSLIAIPGNYHLAIRHRTHFGCMTAAAQAFTATAIPIDLRSSTTATYGTNARKTVGSREVLWAGNAIGDNQLVYVGADNDRDPILVAIGGTVPTNTAVGYRVEDFNMDGTVKYTGEANDRDGILVNIGGAVPTNTRTEQLP